MVFSLVKRYYNAVTYDADPRMTKYPLMSSIYYPIGILVLYFYFVKRLGPRLMQNRKPYELKKFMIVYNLAQIFLCGYLFVDNFSILTFFDWRCATPTDHDSPRAAKTIFYAYYYFLLKILDLLDTVFFVLRKKYNQITILHTYHHAMMIISVWSGLVYYPDGHAVYLGMINSLVHAFMYTYYLMAAIDKKYQQNLTLKKCMTLIQLFQFILLTIIYGSAYFYPNCVYPRTTAFYVALQAVVMVAMFGNFYVKSYILKKPRMQTKKEN